MVGTPLRAVDMARDAALSMTDEQKIAFAIELVNGVTSEHCAWHLQRLGQSAIAAGNRISREAFLRRTA